MAYQRAVINCEKCHNECKDGQNPPTMEDRPEAFNARNEALRALEHEIDKIDTVVETSNSENVRHDAEVSRKWAYRLMDDCMNCDYREPCIANHYREDDEAV